MTKIYFCALALLLSTKILLAEEQGQRFVKRIRFPDAKEFVVIAEGEFEPRSIGSYSVRIYSGLNPDFPLDDYVDGLVKSRDGAIEQVQFHDFDGDGRAEIVVIIRSPGSGGYLSADLFAYAKKSLKLVASLSGLPKNADLFRALTEELKKRSRQ